MFYSGTWLAYAALLVQGAVLADEVVFVNHAGYITIISLEGDIGIDINVS